MSHIVKMRLADGLEEILQEKSIAKLTISDIVSVSGVSRQTFYNNFIDIYDLVYWTHTMRIREAVDTFWEEEDFIQAFETATTIMRKHKIFYQQIIRKEGINSFQSLFAHQNVKLSKIRIKKKIQKACSRDEEFLLELYWYGVSQMLINWILEGMKEEPKELSKLFYEGLPFALRQYWEKS